MSRLLSIALTFAASLPALAQPALGVAAPGVAPEDDRDLGGEAEIVANVNALRAEAGVEALSRDTALDRAAAVHSRDMAAHGELVHVSERTGNPADRVRRAGVEPERVGENIAQGADADAAYATIVASDVHRNQLLDPSFTHLGVAVVRGAEGVYLTQVFARLAPLAAPATPLPPPSVQDVAPPPAAAATPDAVPQLEQVAPGTPATAGDPPLPPNARPAHLLRPNLDATGPPPVYAAVPPAPGHRIQVWPWRASPRPLWRTPRRRVYWY